MKREPLELDPKDPAVVEANRRLNNLLRTLTKEDETIESKLRGIL